MNSDCSFIAITGGRYGSESKHRSRSVDCVPLLSCKRDISAHKSAFTLSDFDNEVYLILSRASIFSSSETQGQIVGPKTKIKMGGKKFDFCSSNFFPPVLIFVFGHTISPWVSEDAIFSTPANISQLVICPAHRAALGIGWRRSANERCRIPVILLHHSDDVLKKRREGSPKPTPSSC